MKHFIIFISTIILLQSCSIISIKETSSLDSIIAKLDVKFEEKVKKNIPGAVVIFVKNGEIYYQQAFGYKDKENNVIMTNDSIFQVASISKSFCAFGVMKLYEDGIIKLDDSIEKYLTRWQFPVSKYQAHDVTFQRLLSHTAGTSVHGFAGYPPNIGLPSVEQSLLGNPESIYGEYHKSPVVIEREPGKKWKYSGGGYTVLQLAIEEITGKNFSEYMDINILKPLTMNDSSFKYVPEMKVRLAIPYNSSVSSVPNYLFTEEAAAGLYTTGENMANMIIELIKCYHGEENNFILKRDSLISMLESQAKLSGMQAALLGKNTRMGLGIFITDLRNGKKTFGHGGNNQGWTSHFEICPDTKDGMIILTNGNFKNFKLTEPLRKAWLQYIENQQ